MENLSKKFTVIGLIIIAMSLNTCTQPDKVSPPITTNHTVYGYDEASIHRAYTLNPVQEYNHVTETRIIYNPDKDYANPPEQKYFSRRIPKLTISIVSQGSHGLAKVEDYNGWFYGMDRHYKTWNKGEDLIKYTPNESDFVGTDTITYKVNDGKFDSNTSSIVYVISKDYKTNNEIEDRQKQRVYQETQKESDYNRKFSKNSSKSSGKSSGCSSKGCISYSDRMIQERAKNHYWDKYGLAARVQNCNPSAGTVRKNGDIYTVSIFCGANNPKDYKLRCCNGKLEIISVN